MAISQSRDTGPRPQALAFFGSEVKEGKHTLMPIKILVGLIWLGLAFWSYGNPSSRKAFAYLGCIVTFVHACALAGGMLLNWFTGRTSVEGGVNMAGFLVGGVLGLVLGSLLGGVAAKNDIVYWLAQIASVGFIVFLSLFRW